MAASTSTTRAMMTIAAAAFVLSRRACVSSFAPPLVSRTAGHRRRSAAAVVRQSAPSRVSLGRRGTPWQACCVPARPLRSAAVTDVDAAAPSSTGEGGSKIESLAGIDLVRSSVLSVLEELYDPADVARGAAAAKLDGGGKKKKKKKKKKGPQAEAEAPAPEEEKPAMTAEERESILSAAAAAAKPFTVADTAVTSATKPEFGDYQCNAALSLAKSLGLPPRKVAESISEALAPKLAGVFEDIEIAGPGFVNLRFTDEYLSNAAGLMDSDKDRLGVPPSSNPDRVVVDYSSPNIAKEMHVGHLRSTIIGDTLSNLLEFAGHDVLRLNHVGDWGTQFGMLVEHLRDEYPAALDPETSKDVDLGDLVALYKAAKKRFDDDDDFKVRSREGVVRLQAGDAQARSAWESLCAASRQEYQKIYDALSIEGLNERGESYYNPYLADVVSDLEGMGLAVESEGATAVFLDGYTNRDGSPLPMLVRKSDGGYNYATTDLAAIRQRVQMSKEDGGEGADRVLYVTDAGQSQHFEMVFAAARKSGFAPDETRLEHVPFGLVQGEDGKKFATRSGDTVRLRDLLDEAVKIAGEDMLSRREGDEAESLSDDEASVARTVGIGAVKYADLSMNRESNYRFSYGRMLSLNGNTAPYMLYAYARICGIVRRATGQEEGTPVVWPEPAERIVVSDDSERQLIRNLAKLPDVLGEVEADLYPNRLCDYLFETSQLFNKFYENCSVNNAETPELRASRLSLCAVTASTIRLLLGILGIPVVEKL